LYAADLSCGPQAFQFLIPDARVELSPKSMSVNDLQRFYTDFALPGAVCGAFSTSVSLSR